MSTTLLTLRQTIGKLTGSYYPFSTTTNIAANNSVIDSKLNNIFDNDDELNDLYWLYLSTTNNPSVERTISDYAQSTGTMTIRGAALTAESTSQTGELHKFRPADIKDALNQAIVREYESIYKEVEDTTLSTAANQKAYTIPSSIRDLDAVYLEKPLGYQFEENILKDYGGFEAWTLSTRPDGTDAATGMTLTQVTEDDGLPVKSESGVKAVVTATTLASHYFTAVTTPADFDSQKTSFQMWVYCTDASRVRVGITDNSSTSYSSYHGGNGWELLSATHTTVVSPTSLKAGIVCTSGDAITIYYDEAAWTRDFRATEDAWEMLRNWRVYNGTLYFHYCLPERYALRLAGRYPLTELTTDTSEVEIDPPQTDILIYSAIVLLYQQYKARKSGNISSDYDKDISYYMSLLEQTKRQAMTRVIYFPMGMYWR